jgi:hypothetical protein
MTKKDLIELCGDFNIEGYTIKKDESGLYIDVDGSVNLNYYALESIPLRFGHVTGSFTCCYNYLYTLMGCPKSVGGDFWCTDNLLTSQKDCPVSVGGTYYCYHNRLSIDSFHQLYEIGYEAMKISSDFCLLSARRQWVLKKIIND